jgi:16S rRNA (guanine527-N7)-methyltransferase
LTSRELKTKLSRRARKVGIRIPEALTESLESYFRLLALWNQKINLTALRLDEASDEAIDRLLIEPLVAARQFAGNERVLDVGSGGGSPAIPLKLALPGISLLMVESKIRKSAFLREAARHLSLSGVEVETARVEELLPRPDLHEASDVVTVRAVRVELRMMLSLQAFLVPGGRILLFRGAGASDAPSMLPPPLVWVATHPLVDALHSRLVVLQKAQVGGWPRG